MQPCIHRSKDRSIEYAWVNNFTLQDLLGLQRSCKSYLARREITLWLDLTKAFHIAELSTMFARLWIVFSSGNGKEWILA